MKLNFDKMHMQTNDNQKHLYLQLIKRKIGPKQMTIFATFWVNKGLHISYFTLTLCIWETPKEVLLQTVKTQMKCSIMLHFIRLDTVRKGKKKDLQTKENNIFFFANYNVTPLDR